MFGSDVCAGGVVCVKVCVFVISKEDMKISPTRTAAAALFIAAMCLCLGCGKSGNERAALEVSADSAGYSAEYAASLKPFKQGDKYGYKDAAGNTVIEPRFYRARRFKEGLAAVNHGRWLKDRWGYIDPGGNFIVPAAFEYANDFKEGQARVKQNGVWRIVVRRDSADFKLIPGGEDKMEEYALQKFPGPLPGMEFVQIPAGIFLMGSDSGKFETPPHLVGVAPFQMMTTEVTQAQWRKVMKGQRPSYFKGDSLPVEMIVMVEIQHFIRRLNGLDPGNRYRLPSEAEWEYACRAGSKGDFCYGEEDSLLGDYGWFAGNAVSTMPVAGKLPNAWGLFDMHGNAREICADHFHSSYEGAPADGEAWVDSVITGYSLTARGGSWNLGFNDCRSASRTLLWRNGAWNTTGFRLARLAERGE